MNAANNEGGGTYCDSEYSDSTSNTTTNLAAPYTTGEQEGIQIQIIDDNGHIQILDIDPDILAQILQQPEDPNPSFTDASSIVPEGLQSTVEENYQELPIVNQLPVVSSTFEELSQEQLESQQTLSPTHPQFPLPDSSTGCEEEFNKLKIATPPPRPAVLEDSSQSQSQISCTQQTSQINGFADNTTTGNKGTEEGKTSGRKRPRKQPINSKQDYSFNTEEPAESPSNLQISDARLGRPFTHASELDNIPVDIQVPPALLYRQNDTSRNTTALPLYSFAVKCATKHTDKDSPDINHCRADLLTLYDNQEFAKVLRFSSIENPLIKSRANVATFAIEENEGPVVTSGIELACSDFLIRAKTLVLRHPILRLQKGSIRCCFPFQSFKPGTTESETKIKIISAEISRKEIESDERQQGLLQDLDIKQSVYPDIVDYINQEFGSSPKIMEKQNPINNSVSHQHPNSNNGGSSGTYQMIIPIQQQINPNLRLYTSVTSPMRLVYAMNPVRVESESHRSPVPVSIINSNEGQIGSIIQHTINNTSPQRVNHTPIRVEFEQHPETHAQDRFVKFVSICHQNFNNNNGTNSTAGVQVQLIQNSDASPCVTPVNGLTSNQIPSDPQPKPKAPRNKTTGTGRKKPAKKSQVSVIQNDPSSSILPQCTDSSTLTPVQNVNDQTLDNNATPLANPLPPPPPTPPPSRTDPERIKGHAATCPNCGICSDNLHRCIRCKKEIPMGTKIIPDPWNQEVSATQTPSRSSPTVPQSTAESLPTGKSNKKVGNKKGKASGTRNAKSTAGSKRTQEECIVLSSDDEDSPRTKIPKVEPVIGSPVPNSLSPTKELRINLCRSDAVIATSSKSSNTDGDETTNKSDPDAVLHQMEHQLAYSSDKNVQINCRSVRIGDWKCAPPINKPNLLHIVILKDGIIFHANHLANRKLVKYVIPKQAILRFLINTKSKLPLIAISTGPAYALHARRKFGFSENPATAPHYFCPNGESYQQHICFFFTEAIKDADMMTIREMYGRQPEEVDYNKANEFLSRIQMPQESSFKSSNSPQKPGSSNARHSLPATNSVIVTNNNCVNSIMTRQSTAEDQQQVTVKVDISENKTLLSYHGIAILQQDILCLATEQFLNDSIMDFWLRYIENEVLSPEDKARTYMFSTFFYKRLTTKPPGKRAIAENQSNLTNAERRHARVERWTKKVDIFEKDFIIVPINESCHWFLAVICFPGLSGVHDFDTGEPLPSYRVKKKPKKSVSKPSTPVPVGDNSTNEEMETNGEVSNDKTDTEMTETESPIPNIEEENSEKSSIILTPANAAETIKEKLRIKQPCILILDSLAGEPRSRVYSTLREYLKMEYKAKKGEDREFTKQTMPGDMPKVLQQPNHCDCGIFTLFYVENFFRFAINSFEFPIDDDKTLWHKIPWESKREEIYNCIRELVKKTNPDELHMIPRLIFPLKIKKEKHCNSNSKSHNSEGALLKEKMEQLKEQIESAPVEKVEKVSESEELMDVDVDNNDDAASQSRCSIPTTPTGTPLKPTVVEMTRASPADTDKDHDYTYTPIPSRNTSPI